jgi:hypothetical protein
MLIKHLCLWEAILFKAKYHVRDTVLLSGWLFADLLLGLAVIFFVALPGAPAPPPPIVKWQVTPTSLSPDSPACNGQKIAPVCTVTLSETSDSERSLDWTTSSDMSGVNGSNPVIFDRASGTLSPKGHVLIKISGFSCQNGSFMFSSPQATTLTVPWHCNAPPDRLNFNYKKLNLTVDYNGLLAGSSSAINNVISQINQSSFEQDSVGLAIVYGGAPDDSGIGQAQTIANKVYDILKTLPAFDRSSYYVPLYTLGPPPSAVEIDLYLFET